ncbi:uncharacterized protein CTHT_0003870 [Thermochaetoides thermophila DSM 1495]|jgi:hypothetical protein|uniref:Uncharacterized protein n=1 Tax=Chaetomium thermophilum (strain DSM 1495 / CBS 144.50 / IMI 039719) TaxID=759272 RepID=G0RZR2_CHATD|nr:hypothetical protein CTHT_0003870 [Thermochaetoides thermophila DSM 1495]EGS23690.1 hypothetical protein CTHT_0003870 [Thermochaetoides thermophila DSM 1495]
MEATRPQRQSSKLPFEGPGAEFVDTLFCGHSIPNSGQANGASTRKLLKSKADHKEKRYLPGQPRIRLEVDENARRSTNDDPQTKLYKYLKNSHSTKHLDGLLPFTRFIFVQTPSYDHIMPLHHQTSHAREIKVDEHPGLHLVWYYNMVFIKPVPLYFFSKAFWEYLRDLEDDKYLYHACLGFMRSYYYLIQYEIDYTLACEKHLIPLISTPDGRSRHPTYEEWCEFIAPFGEVGDDEVTRRYHYGELRLTRINNAAMMTFRSLAYYHIYPQWGDFLKHMLAPLLTIFAVCSVVLGCMQVGLAALEVDKEINDSVPNGAWSRFLGVSLWFSIIVMVIIAVVLFVALVGLIWMAVHDVFRGNEVRQKRKRQERKEHDIEEKPSHGLIW